MNKEEEWKDVVGFPRYEVSTYGRVRTKPLYLKPGAIRGAHLTVALCSGKGKPKTGYVHRLVAQAFIPNPEGLPIINHKNGNPQDNRINNLEWCTHSHNVLHGYHHNGKRNYNEVRMMAVNANGEIVASFRSGSDAAVFLGVTTAAVNSSIRRKGTCKGFRFVPYE